MMLSNMHSAEVLRAELALLREARNNGEPMPPPSHPLRRQVKDLFYPADDEDWKRSVDERGSIILNGAVRWLMKDAGVQAKL